MKDKDLIEILTFLLKGQREQKERLDSLTRAVAILQPAGAELPRMLSSEPIDEQTARTVAELLLLLDQPPSE